MKYGGVLKDYLLKEFELEQIISLDRSVFENAEVSSPGMFATRKTVASKQQNLVRFARVRNGLAINKLSSFVIDKKAVSDKDIVVKDIKK